MSIKHKDFSEIRINDNDFVMIDSHEYYLIHT